MAKYKEFIYETSPSILAGGTIFEYQFLEPFKGVVRVILKEGIVSEIIDSTTPEIVAYELYPIFKKYLEKQLEKNGIDLVKESFENKKAKLLMIEEITDDLYSKELLSIEEKIKIFLTISYHNIFSDENIPSSIRLLSEMMNIPEENILDAVKNNSAFELIEEKFIKFRGVYDL